MPYIRKGIEFNYFVVRLDDGYLVSRHKTRDKAEKEFKSVKRALCRCKDTCICLAILTAEEFKARYPNSPYERHFTNVLINS